MIFQNLDKKSRILSLIQAELGNRVCCYKVIGIWWVTSVWSITRFNLLGMDTTHAYKNSERLKHKLLRKKSKHFNPTGRIDEILYFRISAFVASFIFRSSFVWTITLYDVILNYTTSNRVLFYLYDFGLAGAPRR